MTIHLISRGFGFVDCGKTVLNGNEDTTIFIEQTNCKECLTKTLVYTKEKVKQIENQIKSLTK